MATLTTSTCYAASEADLIALAREPGAFQAIMRSNNRRLYRVARAVLGDDAEAEDVVQETYLKAFQNLARFRGDPFRIALVGLRNHLGQPFAGVLAIGLLRAETRRLDDDLSAGGQARPRQFLHFPICMHRQSQPV